MSTPRFAVVAAATAAAFWPTWFWYVARLRDGADEKLGLVAVVAAAVIAVFRRAPHRVAPPLVVLAVLAAAHGLLTVLDWPALVRAGLALLAVALVVSAAAFGRRLHPGTAVLLLLGLPLESTLQFYLGYPLRAVATVMAAGLLRPMGLDVAPQGTLLHWRGEAIGVDPACSGIHMLWVALLAAAVLSAARDLDLRRTTLASLLGVAAVVLGNGFRVAALFLKEAGVVAAPAWTHEAFGGLVFLATVWALLEAVRRLPPAAPAAAPLSTPVPAAALAAFAAVALGSAAIATAPRAASSPSNDAFPGWPQVLDGSALLRVPDAPEDARFARGFPGRLARFTDGRRAILLRWLSGPTRRLHPAADCFRGSGYTTAPAPARVDNRGQRWGCLEARRGPRAWSVCERIVDAEGRSWTDTSSWWWASALGRARGPYWAMTVMEPRG